MRRSDFIAGAAGVGELIAAGQADAALVGVRRALLRSAPLNVNLLMNPALTSGASSWNNPSAVPISANGPGGALAFGYLGTGTTGSNIFIFQFNSNPTIPVVGGGTYKLSWWVDTTQLTTSTTFQTYAFNGSGAVARNYFTTGSAGVQSFTYKLPGNYFDVYFALLMPSSAVITNGDYVYASQPYFARIA